MKQIRLASIIVSYLILFVLSLNVLWGQANCVLQPPLLRIDFGSSNKPMDLNQSSMENYQRADYCPQDGSYAIVPATSDCFHGHWVTLDQDHTPNDFDGKMLLVNAAYQPGLFFVGTLMGLSPNKTYELGVWIMNVCKPRYDCTNIRPDLRFVIENVTGKELARFSTGEINPTDQVSWFQYSAMFKTPADAGQLFLKIINKENGGCGNDFAMDDITIRECVTPKPVLRKETKPKLVSKQPPPAAKPVAKQTATVLKQPKKVIPVITKTTVKDIPVIKERTVISLPKPILTRANPIVKQIETIASEIVIDLYDNGEIDGDTVSIYHNNVLIVSRAGLSEKPVSFHFAVDASHPHHELVMVANNLGSIPPNTSLMILTAGDKRYEVFISSSEQKNAKLVIELKSP